MIGIYNLEKLEEEIRNEQGILLYFSNESCSVCKVLKPRVVELLQERFPRMVSYYVDVDKSPLLSGQHRVFTIPTLLVFFQGREHLRLSRNISLHQLEAQLAKPYELILSD